MDLHLTNKVAIVTGSTGGIGRHTAQRLAEEGCAVAICGRTEATLREAEESLASLGGKVFAQVCDVTDAAAGPAFVDAAAEALGGVDILVNNVGGASGGRKPFEETTDDDWQQTFNANIFHAARLTRAAVPHMAKRGGGAVVIVSSISGWRPGGAPQYGSAKAAEIAVAPELAILLAKHRIRVNTVCPGSIIWPGNSWDEFRKDNPEVFEHFEQHGNPWGRLGDPNDVADAICYIASPRAGWINGAMIPVDGGQLWSTVSPRDMGKM